MPDRVQMIGFLIEVIALTIFNAIILITWATIFSAIPIVLSSVWTVGRIKRDVDKFHEGKFWNYIKYLFTLTKKN